MPRTISEMLANVPDLANDRGLPYDLLDKKTMDLFNTLLETCEKYRVDSNQSVGPRIAFNEGVKMLIGNLYEVANDTLENSRDDGDKKETTVEAFIVRGRELLSWLVCNQLFSIAMRPTLGC